MYSNYVITETSQGFMPLLTHMIVNYCTYITVKPADLRANAHTHTSHTFTQKDNALALSMGRMWHNGLSHHAYSNTGK